MNKTSWLRTNWVFFTVLLAGCVVRIVFSAGHGYSNDELSALIRTRLISWDEFWFYGVSYGDMHPALYQGLLWLWVRCFGEGEFMVRLPGILFFALGQLLLYRSLKTYVHRNAGIVITLLTGLLGFLIMHSTFARPYNAGVFFLTLMCCSYLRIKSCGNIEWKDILQLGFCAGGALLSHYFAGLVAFLFLGFLFLIVDFQGKKSLTLSGAIGFITFLPHLNATLSQLSKGGLQWLAPPDAKWLPDTMWLVFNESWLVTFVTLLFFLWLLLIFGWKNKREGHYELLLFFVLVIVVGYLISYWYTPILRDLVIVFLIPFLLVGIVGSIRFEEHRHFPTATLTYSLFLVANTFIGYRIMGTHHFGVFREIGDQINRSVAEIGKNNIVFASNTNNIDYLNYYLHSPMKEAIGDWTSESAIKEMSLRVNIARTPFFCYTFNNAYDQPIFMEMIRRRYPMVSRSYFEKGSHLVLFCQSKKGTKPIKKSIIKGSLKTSSSNKEFQVDVKIPLSQLPENRGNHQYYLFECFAKQSENGNVFLVATIEKNGKQVLKKDAPLFYIANNQSDIVKQDDCYYLAFTTPPDVDPQAEIHLYIWNPQRLRLNTREWSLQQICLPLKGGLKYSGQ
jgi:hypothetical protein